MTVIVFTIPKVGASQQPMKLLFRFYDGDISDDYGFLNTADFRGLKIEDLMASLKALRVNYFFGKINDLTDKMIKEFCLAAKQENFIRTVDLKSPSDIIDASFQIATLSAEAKTQETLGAM